MTHNMLCIWCGAKHSKCEDPECPDKKDHHVEGLYCSPQCEEDDLAQQRRDAYGEDEGVKEANRLARAQNACRKLIAAYENSVDQVAWEDLNDAYQAACDALGHVPTYPREAVEPLHNLLCSKCDQPYMECEGECATLVDHHPPGVIKLYCFNCSQEENE